MTGIITLLASTTLKNPTYSAVNTVLGVVGTLLFVAIVVWSLPAAGIGVAGYVDAPHRYHASRRFNIIQAMAYTMATNRHMTPKPGQGWRLCAEW
jgi:hypothetical protein